MDQCGVQRANALSVCEEMRSGSSLDRGDAVVCPKPRRLGLLNGAVNDLPVRSLRWHLNCQSELCDSRAGTDLLDAILTKDDHGAEPIIYTRVASPPPFFSGSPPSRVANPLIQDVLFRDEKRAPFPSLLPIPPPSGLPSPPSSIRKGGCVRANFGNKPVVRIEGFDCLDRNRRSCSIPALA